MSAGAIISVAWLILEGCGGVFSQQTTPTYTDASALKLPFLPLLITICLWYDRDSQNVGDRVMTDTERRAGVYQLRDSGRGRSKPVETVV